MILILKWFILHYVLLNLFTIKKKEMNKKYLVKLTPHDNFFFGGETTFGEVNANYFVKSNYYPQQTSLLGLIRYQLLAQDKNGIFKNNVIENPQKASGLIGANSFHFKKDFSFGKIKSISPVFISDSNNNYLFQANKEYQVVDGNFVLRQYDTRNGKSTIYKENLVIPFLSGYKAKDGLPELLINKDLSIIKHFDFEFNGMFIKNEQVGIRKNYDGNSGDKAYYIQIFFKIVKGYSFVFILELEDNDDFESQNVVVLGGEQSKFKMDVSEFVGEFNDLVPDYEKSDNVDKVVLVSDAYLGNEIFDVCDFAITDIIDFRSIESSVENTKNYSAFNKTDTLNKTAKFNLFKKGSVLYGNVGAISNLINKNESLQKVGYNHFKEINKKS